jgi:hypothetical protein
MDDFHAEHLTDEQMAEINPLIRNAIYDVLIWQHCGQDKSEDPKMRQECLNEIAWLLTSIPSYWEEPEHSKEYVEEKKSFDLLDEKTKFIIIKSARENAKKVFGSLAD